MFFQNLHRNKVKCLVSLNVVIAPPAIKCPAAYRQTLA